jgi:hypothetical protein
MNRQDDELAFYPRPNFFEQKLTNHYEHFIASYRFWLHRSEKTVRKTWKGNSKTLSLFTKKKKNTNNKLEQKILFSASDICRGLNYFRFLKGLHFYLNPVRYTVRLLLFPFNINTFEWRLSLFISISSFAHFIVHLATSFQCSFTSFNSGIIETKTKIPVRLNM